ncbi:hypothetical protein BDZ89DRAFT_1126379 [Hymenopellis radicata]|nr:hypothetical protein BDZ89DRAFT_1126379 [Hymenopellis radicata]
MERLTGFLEAVSIPVKAVVTGAIGSAAQPKLQSLGLGPVMLERLMPITTEEDVDEDTGTHAAPTRPRITVMLGDGSMS